jgi:hypothetical protein
VHTWLRLRWACLRDDARAADAALRDAWATLASDTQQMWLQDPDLARALTALARHRFGPSGRAAPSRSTANTWDGTDLWQALRRLQRSERATARNALPTLHP